MNRYDYDFGWQPRPRGRYDLFAREARGAPVRRQHAGGWIRAYDRDLRRGPLTGMESNRLRGVYGSDFQARHPVLPGHGGYVGVRWNWGGGMNPGRRGGW